MMYQVTVQRTVPKNVMPSTKNLKHWAKTALKYLQKNAELNIRVVDLSEITALNAQYRHKNKPTNVLSFPFDMPEEIDDELSFLGDIIICADVVNNEAQLQHKSKEAHWAHMVVHGTLHLIGYDHETDADAATMEPKETAILTSLGFPNPYHTEEKGE